jgi:hypothetical protein
MIPVIGRRFLLPRNDPAPEYQLSTFFFFLLTNAKIGPTKRAIIFSVFSGQSASQLPASWTLTCTAAVETGQSFHDERADR